MQTSAKNSMQRFSDRVENYVKYRPGYPTAIIDLLKAECGLNSSSIVADVGAGTGLFAELLLPNVKLVFGVEPNREMREAAERLLKNYPGFKSVSASSEQTDLDSNSVDFVTAAQAFHWFNPVRTQAEFRRILKPVGWVILIWNERLVDTTPFLRAYEDLLLKFSTDYDQVDHRRTDEKAIGSFFSPSGFKKRSFENAQHFDFDGLKGRLLSSSYAPAEGHPNHKPMLEALKKIFSAHQANGKVSFNYETKVFFGQLS
jgi:SAM-dependent methyltransferase